jgi:hypothetical protein
MHINLISQRHSPITSIVSSNLRANSNGLILCSISYGKSLRRPVKRSVVPSPEGFAVLSSKLSERIIARLFDAERKEGNAHLRDDYRIAAKTVYNCSKNYPHAWNLAFCEYLGKHPSKLIPFLAAQADRYRAEAEKNLRELEALTMALPPRKPSVSVPARKKAA